MPEGTRLPIRVLLARLVVLALVPVALLSAWSIMDTIRGQRQASERSVLELSRALASAVDSDLEATRQVLMTMGRSDTLRRGDLHAFYERAGKEMDAHPDWSAVVLTDNRGELVFNTMRPFDSPDRRIIDPPSLDRVLRTGAPAVGRLLSGRTSLAFPVRVPVFIDGKLTYVLTAAVRPDHVVQVLLHQRTPPGRVLAVFDSARTRVARSIDQSRTVGGPATPELLALFDRPGNDGVGLTSTIEGEQVFTGFTRIAPDGWLVAVGAPTSDIKRALAGAVAWHVGGILLSLLACLVLGRRMVRRIGDDVAHIRDEAVKVSEARVVEPARSDIVELDEIGRALGAASNRLSENARIARDALAAADSAAAAKDEFLAVLGHELRNPLAPMLTALQLVDMKAPGTAVRERQIMRRQIDHMRRLVDDLLDVSRITRGKLEIRREPVLMQAVVEQSVDTVAPAASARAHPIEVTLPPGPAWVLGDETRLVQTVSNVLANALRYGGDGRIRLALETQDERVRVTVADEGQGMDADALQRAFDAFYQAPQGSARKVGGLGLGLAIVRSIMSLHGGQVVAHSDGPGRGSRFVLEWPAIDAPAGAPAPAPAHAQRRAGRIAVVDDNGDALEMIAEALRTAGHVVEAMRDPHAALARIPSFDPDIAILDLGMPGMDGFELAAALVAAGWQGRLVALTGYGQESDRRRSSAAGFALHLTKPLDTATLLASIETLVRSGAASST